MNSTNGRAASDVLLDARPPNDPDAERYILGANFLDNATVDQAAELLKREDFFLPSHQWVYDRILYLHENGKGVDPITVQDELRKIEKLDLVGGPAFVASLFDGVPRFSNITNYVENVKVKSVLRRLALVLNKGLMTCFEADGEPIAIMEQLGQECDDLASELVRSGFVRIGDIAGGRLAAIEDVAANGETVTGISTGFSDLDYMTQGLHRKDLILIAARPSMGKTGLGMNIATNVASKPGSGVGVFSLEMSKEQLVDRILCSQARIDSYRLRSGYLSHDEWRRLAVAVGEVSEMDLYIDDSPSLTLTQLRAKARRLKAKLKVQGKSLELLVIDYLQLMQGKRAHGASRQEEVAGISRGLKGLAKELDCPIIALAQLSRAPDTRTGNHKPQLSDLRESGGLEQDADVVMFIYREEVYKPETEKQNIAEIIIGKQRNGPIGIVELVFLKQLTRFENKFKEAA